MLRRGSARLIGGADRLPSGKGRGSALSRRWSAPVRLRHRGAGRCRAGARRRQSNRHHVRADERRHDPPGGRRSPAEASSHARPVADPRLQPGGALLDLRGRATLPDHDHQARDRGEPRLQSGCGGEGLHLQPVDDGVPSQIRALALGFRSAVDRLPGGGGRRVERRGGSTWPRKERPRPRQPQAWT